MTPTTPQGEAPKKKMSTTAIVLIVLGVGGGAMLCCISTLAAIAIPNFIKFQARSKQSEVKMNLKAAFSAEKAFFGEKDAYSDSASEVGFSPERGNRYLYVVSPESKIDADARMSPDNAALLAGIPAALMAETGVHGTCPDECHVTIVGVGNIDNDPDVDLWSISTEARTIDGTPVPAGQPYNHHSDI